MHFESLPDARHAHVVIRPLQADDIPHWFAYLSQRQVFEHTSWNVKTPADLLHYAPALEAPTPSSMLRLAIADRQSNQLVGTIGFHTVSVENRCAELAYDLAPALWGRGIASHVCQVLVDWAHAHVGIARVQATVLESSARSLRVLERCGFRPEGLLRSYRMVRGAPGDFWMYSHLPGDGMPPS